MAAVLVLARSHSLNLAPPPADDREVRQLASSIFDAAAAVAFIVGVLVVALHPTVASFAFVAGATIVLIIRLAVERRHA